MRNHIGYTGAFDLPDGEPCNPPRALSRSRGVTLIELSFVIGIIAIIVVAALAVYNAVRNSQDLTTVVSDVSAIRTAVSNWAGNEPIFRVGSAQADPSVTELDNLEQLNRLLPGKLRELARPQDRILEGANPWQGNYEVNQQTDATVDLNGQPVAINPNPFVFQIKITNIPRTQHEPLRRRLEEGAESISETLGTAVVEDESARAELVVVYRI